MFSQAIQIFNGMDVLPLPLRNKDRQNVLLKKPLSIRLKHLILLDILMAARNEKPRFTSSNWLQTE